MAVDETGEGRNAKLETAEQLVRLFNDHDWLQTYHYAQPLVSSTGVDGKKFHLELPYQEIVQVVEEVRAGLFARIPPAERVALRWEHVGSTSIEGMPGTKMPDALLILPQFPPSLGVVQALLDTGFYFARKSFLDDKDLWWFLVFTDGILKDIKMTVHMSTEDNPSSRVLLGCRDLCRTEPWAFNDYRDAKIAASAGSWLEYKVGKGRGSRLLAMLRERHGITAAFNPQ
jgi:GrpB-like predicted nucleotidyltransferase (UPF0157 family)